jgi:predicted transcriptional regulator
MSDESTTATIGDQELALLTWIAAHEGATVGEVADGFGAERGLARSTVLTMMERLRKKGFLTRRQKEGVYRYRSAMGPHDVLKRAVRSFVDRTLGGSVSPVVAYLTESADELTPEQVQALERVVSRLRGRQGDES